MSDGWQEVPVKSQSRSKPKLQASSSGHNRRPAITNSFICDQCCDDQLSVSASPQTIQSLGDSVVMSVMHVLNEIITPQVSSSPFTPSALLRAVTALGKDLSNLTSEYEQACTQAALVFRKMAEHNPTDAFTSISLRSVCYPATNALIQLINTCLEQDKVHSAQDVLCPLWPHITAFIGISLFSVPKHEYQSVRSENNGKTAKFPFFAIFQKFRVDELSWEDSSASTRDSLCSLGSSSQFSISTLSGVSVSCVCEGQNSAAIYDVTDTTCVQTPISASKSIHLAQYIQCVTKLTTAVHQLFRLTSNHVPAPSPWWGWSSHSLPELLLRQCRQGQPQVSTLWTPALHSVIPTSRKIAKQAILECLDILTQATLQTNAALPNISTSYLAAVARAVAEYIDILIRPYAHQLLFDNKKLATSPVIGTLQQQSTAATSSISKLTQVLHKHKENSILTMSYARLLLSLLPIAYHPALCTLCPSTNITLAETLLYLAATPTRLGKKKQQPSPLYLLVLSMYIQLPHQHGMLSMKALSSPKQHSLLTLMTSTDSSARTQTTASMLMTQYLFQLSKGKTSDSELPRTVYAHVQKYISAQPPSIVQKFLVSNAAFLRYVMKMTSIFSTAEVTTLMQVFVTALDADATTTCTLTCALLVEFMEHSHPDSVCHLDTTHIPDLGNVKLCNTLIHGDMKYAWLFLCSSLHQTLPLDQLTPYITGTPYTVSHRITQISAKFPNRSYPTFVHALRCLPALTDETVHTLLTHADPTKPEELIEIVSVQVNKEYTCTSTLFTEWIASQFSAIHSTKTKAQLQVLPMLCALQLKQTRVCGPHVAESVELLLEQKQAPLATLLLRTIADFYNTPSTVDTHFFTQILTILNTLKDKVWNAAATVTASFGFFSSLTPAQKNTIVSIYASKLDQQNIQLRSYVVLLTCIQKLVSAGQLQEYHSILVDFFVTTPISLDDSVSQEAPSRSALEEKAELLRIEIAQLFTE